MASDKPLLIEILPLIRVYADNTIERLIPFDAVPPSLDAAAAAVSKDVVIDKTTGLSARLYRPNTTTTPSNKLPVLIYYHGGGFCLMSPAAPMFHAFLNSLVAEAKVVAVSLDYRLAPEHPIPAAYDDAAAALRWVAAHAAGSAPAEAEPWLSDGSADLARVFLAGDSCGANMAHNVAMGLGAEGGEGVEGVALLFPYFWGTERLPSELSREGSAPSFAPPDDVEKLWPYISGKGHDDPRVNFVADGAPSLARLGCRRVLVEVAEKDTLRDRGNLYGEELKRSGWSGEVQVWETEGEDHDFALFEPATDKAAQFRKRLSDFINKE